MRHDGAEQLFLADEMGIDRGLGGGGLARHPIHRHRDEAAFEKGALGGGKDRLGLAGPFTDGRLLAFAASLRHPHSAGPCLARRVG